MAISSQNPVEPAAQKRKPLISWRGKLLFFVVLIAALGLTLFFAFPRAASFVFRSKYACEVVRVEPFMKGINLNSPTQMNKFSVLCADGTICRAEDTGFASVKAGDLIEFRGYPEFGSLEEFGKCDHAQLIKILRAGAGQ